MTQVLALKLGASANGFLWAFVSINNRWGFTFTLMFCLIALGFGAAAARDLAYIGSRDWHDQ